MPRSSFRLPGIQELSKQQRNALDLPLEGQHLIVGGPGTGKSVVALMRAGRLAREKRNYLFLVYNILLDKNSYGLAGSELRAATWKKWFKDSFKSWFDEKMPEKIIGNDRIEDWDTILNMTPREDVDTSLYLVIDEGQDMPPQFYEVLDSIGFENFYVVADQNQQIAEHYCSSRKDIEKALGLKPVDTLELTDNYRNSFPIARLAQAFFTNDPASPRVELPKPRPGDRIPRLVGYGENMLISFNRIIESILRTYDLNIDKLICVITPNDEIRIKFVENLRDCNPKKPFDHKKPTVQTYSSGDPITEGAPIGSKAPFACPSCGANMELRRNGRDRSLFWGCSNWKYDDEQSCSYTKPYITIDFRNGGIAVINQQSIKGLEFDVVFIAEIDSFWSRETDGLMKKFYVMVSRARDDIILLRTGEIDAEVDKIIPNDESLLERK